MKSKFKKGYYWNPYNKSYVYVDVWMNEHTDEYNYHFLYYFPTRDYRDQFYHEILGERHLNEEYVNQFIPIEESPAEIAKLLLIDMRNSPWAKHARPISAGGSKAYKK
jgi:hypothetical protein